MCKPIDRRVRVSCCTSLTLGLRPRTALRQKRSIKNDCFLGDIGSADSLAGGVIGYGTNLTDAYRQAAVYADRPP
jgi:hypothetical protein